MYMHGLFRITHWIRLVSGSLFMFDEDPNDHPLTITHGDMLGGQDLDALVGKCMFNFIDGVCKRLG